MCSSLFTSKYFSTPEAGYVKRSEAGNFNVPDWGKLDFKSKRIRFSRQLMSKNGLIYGRREKRTRLRCETWLQAISRKAFNDQWLSSNLCDYDTLKGNWIQGWHYGKWLIYYRPIFRLTKLANKLSLCRSASPAFSFVIFYTLSDVWLQHLFN